MMRDISGVGPIDAGQALNHPQPIFGHHAPGDVEAQDVGVRFGYGCRAGVRRDQRFKRLQRFDDVQAAEVRRDPVVSPRVPLWRLVEEMRISSGRPLRRSPFCADYTKIAWWIAGELTAFA
jgi:hypothetical protein